MYCASNPKGLRVIPGGVDPHILRFISERIDPPGSVAAQGLHFLPDIIDTQKLRFWSIPDQRLDPFSVLIYFGSRAVQYRVLGLYRVNGLIRSPFPIRTGSKDGSARRLAGIVLRTKIRGKIYLFKWQVLLGQDQNAGQYLPLKL